MRTIRIGSGAGYSGDRIEPAVELAEKGDIQYLVFECLGERTVALAQQARMKDPDSGYDPLLEERMRAVLPICAAKGIKIVTNMGAANPEAAARKTAEIAKSLGLSSLKIAAVIGDDVLDACKDGDLPIMEFDGTIRQLGNRLLSANAYLGAEPMAEALTRRRRYRHHRARVRSRAVPGADDPRLRLGDGRLESAGAGHRRRAICWNAPGRSPAAISPIPATRMSRIWRGSAFRSAKSARTARSSSPRSQAPAAR